MLIQNNPFIEYRFPLNLVQRAADATIARYTVGSADRLLAISEFTARYVQRLAPGRQVTVMHLGTDVERFSPVDAAERARSAGASTSRSTRSSRSPYGDSSTATVSTRCSTRPRAWDWPACTS